MSTLSVCLFGKFCARHISEYPEGVDARMLQQLFCYIAGSPSGSAEKTHSTLKKVFGLTQWDITTGAYTKEEHVTRNTLHMAARRSYGVSRRTFLGAGMATGAALLTGEVTSLFPAPVHAAGTRPTAEPPWVEATIPQLQTLMASGQLTSRELTLGYRQRIRDLNPMLGAVIETNPNAVAIAARLDTERRAAACCAARCTAFRCS